MASTFPNQALLEQGIKLKAPSTFNPDSLKKLKKEQALDLMQLSIDEASHFSDRVQIARNVWAAQQKEIKELQNLVDDLDVKIVDLETDNATLGKANDRLKDEKRELSIILDIKFGEIRESLEAQNPATTNDNCPI
jgi:hypothetical protein